jgi:L-malate glycosyltransferase
VARQFAPIADDIITQFAWGIDLPQFPFVPPPQTGPFVVLSTRSWEPLYGTDTLVEGFCLARQQLGAAISRPLKLVMMAGGSLAGKIQDIIAQYGAEDAVQFTGMLPHNQQAAYFAAADVYISCAHTDGTSISLLEAMATGRPVIVTDIPSNREWVGDSGQWTMDSGQWAMDSGQWTVDNGQWDKVGVGWLAAKGDAVAVAAAIVAAAQMPAKARLAVARHNRAVVEARGDWQKNAQRLLGAYARLLGG